MSARMPTEGSVMPRKRRSPMPGPHSPLDGAKALEETRMVVTDRDVLGWVGGLLALAVGVLITILAFYGNRMTTSLDQLDVTVSSLNSSVQSNTDRMATKDRLHAMELRLERVEGHLGVPRQEVVQAR